MVPFHGGGVLVNLEHMYTCIYVVYVHVNIDIHIKKILKHPLKPFPDQRNLNIIYMQLPA